MSSLIVLPQSKIKAAFEMIFQSKQNLTLLGMLEPNGKVTPNTLFRVQKGDGRHAYPVTMPLCQLIDPVYLKQFSSHDVWELARCQNALKDGEMENPFTEKNLKSTTSNSLIPLSLFHFAVLLSANLIAVKEANVFWNPVTCGTFIIPILYMLDDAITEVYGFKASRRVMWFSLMANFSVFAMLYLFTILIPGTSSDLDIAMKSVYGPCFQVIIASATCYVIGDYLNAFTLSKLKILLNGRQLGLRYLLSTTSSVLIETAIFCAILFGMQHGFSFERFSGAFATQVAYKMATSLFLLHFTILFTNWLKEKDQCDHYDYNTDFRIFSLES